MSGVSAKDKEKWITDLEAFCEKLQTYKKRALQRFNGKLTNAEKESLDSLRMELQREHGRLDPIIKEYAGSAYIDIHGIRCDVFGIALDTSHPSGVDFDALDGAIGRVNAAIGKLQSPTFVQNATQGTVLEAPKAFIAHGGESQAFSKLQEFLTALGIEPMFAEGKASQDRSVDEQVDWCMSQGDCAIVLATKGDIDGKTGEFIPRGNVNIEIGRVQERFPGKIVYLLEEGAKFPSNVSEKVWERFTQDNMEKAFIKVVREMTAFGMLKSCKPR